MNDQGESYDEYMAREQAEECAALREVDEGHLCGHCVVLDGDDYDGLGTGENNE